MFREGSKSELIAEQLKKGHETHDIVSALGVSSQLVGFVRRKLNKAEKTTRRKSKRKYKKRSSLVQTGLHVECTIFRAGLEVMRIITTEDDFVETYALAMRRVKGEG